MDVDCALSLLQVWGAVLSFLASTSGVFRRPRSNTMLDSSSVWLGFIEYLVQLGFIRSCREHQTIEVCVLGKYREALWKERQSVSILVDKNIAFHQFEFPTTLRLLAWWGTGRRGFCRTPKHPPQSRWAGSKNSDYSGSKWQIKFKNILPTSTLDLEPLNDLRGFKIKGGDFSLVCVEGSHSWLYAVCVRVL